MRKYQQRQILELLETIHQAQTAGLYADCQDGAVALSEFIGSLKGEGTRTGELLGEYYSLLFMVHSGDADKRTLEAHLTLIETSVRTELKPDKIEIVFLTYKAAMSDCIESVYLAAKADSGCDAYWMPIPYFDKNSDGSFGTLHFEGADYYGSGLCCTDWQSYDMEARRPDAVITFNPYDDVNYVTSVHPDFYCKRLRELTDLLVYIPYFIHYEQMSPISGQIPGAFFSHLIMVQSEHIREQYIDSMAAAGYLGGRQAAENKVVALGSPKTDKVLNSKKSDWNLPVEWEDIFEKKAPSKIVVLYNTSIQSALANCSEGSVLYLQKMENVFAFFQQQTNAILWWRPHPLLEATFRSMLPHLYNQYAELVKNYREEKIGIYDDSPNLNRAITYADMCYGDDSSLGLLLQIAGKPTLLQNVKNQWKVSDIPDTGEMVWQAMEEFVAQGGYNSYMMIERPDTSSEGFALPAFVEHLDVILQYSAAQARKYRSNYINIDGTAGREIYTHIKLNLEERK